jgi:hypothetical protein
MRKVAIVSPSYDGKVVCDYAITLATIFSRAKDMGVDVSLHFWMGEALLQKARNNLFCDAYDSGVDDLFFLDCDQAFDAQAFFDLLNHPVDVVGITAPMKTDEERYTIRPEEPEKHIYDPQLKLLHVENISTGMMRLSRKAMQSLWDNSVSYNDGKERKLICDVQIINGGMISEDIQLCKKLNDAGFKIYADINYTCTHFGTKKFTGNFKTHYLKAFVSGIKP